MDALRELDFEEFLPPVEKFLEQHRTLEKTKKEEKERLKASKPDAAPAMKGDEVDAYAPVSKEEQDVLVVTEGNAAEELDTSANHRARDEEDVAASPSKKLKVDESVD